MKRVAILESAAGLGGAEMNVLHLAQPLRQRGWESVVLTPGQGNLTRALDAQGIRWREFITPPFKSTSRYIKHHKVMDPLATGYDCWLVLQRALGIARLIRSEKIDVLQTNSMLSHLAGGLAARWAGVPCVWHLQDIVEPRAGLGLFKHVLERGAQTLANLVICISQSVARQFSSVKQVKVIYNGIDTELFTPNGAKPFREQWLGTDYQYVVGQVGRLTPWKGQTMLLAAAERARVEQLPIRFVLIGDDSFGEPGYKQQLMNRAAGLGDRVLFTGWLDDVPGAIRSLDLVVHSTLEPEPFGLVVAEAMACGKPVIVANHGGAREVVGADQNGTLIPPGDVPALYGAIKAHWENREHAAELGARARARVVQNFTLARFADEMACAYASVSGTSAI